MIQIEADDIAWTKLSQGIIIVNKVLSNQINTPHAINNKDTLTSPDKVWFKSLDN